MAPNVIRRPLLSIQCDWDEVLKSKDGSAWVSCKEIGGTSKHGKIVCKEMGNGPNFQLQVDGHFGVEKQTEKSITLTHSDPNIRCIFFAASRIFPSPNQKGIVALDTTSKGLGVLACGDNKLFVWDTQNGSILRILEGHIFDVYSCRFFPSGIVILSAGADLQIKIWSAETGNCPVTLIGNTTAVTDTCIVERGRNVISVSRDGNVKLWDCGQAQCLDTISQQEGSINCCAVSGVDIDLGTIDDDRNEREVGTEGKLLILGCESGKFTGVGVRSRKSVFEHNHSSAINCCCYLSKSKVVCGSQDGTLLCFDVSNPSEPSIIWEESTSAVLSLLPIANGFFASRADGTCMFMPLSGDLSVQLTGPGFDPVYCIASDGECIFTGCRDGLLRKYRLPGVIEITLS